MEKGYTIQILGDGHVIYLDHLGSDLRIAEAARVSYLQGTKGIQADTKLIRYLFLNRHTSPFEQCNVTFEIKMPIFVMRQFVRHRTFRLNEVSGRYVELPDQFYSPNRFRAQQSEGNKQGSQFGLSDVINEEARTVSDDCYIVCYTAYKTLLALGVAKELARIVLPVATFTQIHVNIDLHNLLHFLYLRTDHHAQLEIQELAAAMAFIANELFPITGNLFRQFVPKMVERLGPYDENIWRTKPTRSGQES